MITTNISIDQVFQDIMSEKSSMIYYSAQTLWWTHLVDDLENAGVLGRIAEKAKIEEILSNPLVPQSQKDSLIKWTNDPHFGKIPTDPSGSPLYQFPDPMKWLKEAIASPKHYGRHGLNAFILTHHKNSLTMFRSWASVNAKIDQLISNN